ncbi:MAG: hypothetical protein IPM52_11515 [Bacteroidetes bacterium]|nr:hypothetical protein [Bacteroidota bacterium]
MKTIRLFLILLLAFHSAPFELLAQNHYACGEQTGTWQYDTVFVNCNVLVPQGGLLQIMPGTKVVFTGHYAIEVQGNLKALGTASDSIFHRGRYLGFWEYS